MMVHLKAARSGRDLFYVRILQHEYLIPALFAFWDVPATSQRRETGVVDRAAHGIFVGRVSYTRNPVERTDHFLPTSGQTRVRPIIGNDGWSCFHISSR